jgi:hypothetical protein
MLAIRPEQMLVLDRMAREVAKQSALDHLRRERPADLERLGELSVASWLEFAANAVEAYGGRPSDLPGYLGLMFDFGQHFSTETWAAQVLTDPEIPGISKLDVLGIYAKAFRDGQA